MRTLLALLVVVPLTGADPKDGPKKKPAALEGKWEVAAEWDRGHLHSAGLVAEHQLAFEFKKGGEFAIWEFGRVADEGRYTVDSDSAPNRLVIMTLAHKGRRVELAESDEFVYEFRGETLWLAWSANDKKITRIDPDTRDQNVVVARRANK